MRPSFCRRNCRVRVSENAKPGPQVPTCALPPTFLRFGLVRRIGSRFLAASSGVSRCRPPSPRGAQFRQSGGRLWMRGVPRARSHWVLACAGESGAGSAGQCPPDAGFGARHKISSIRWQDISAGPGKCRADGDLPSAGSIDAGLIDTGSIDAGCVQDRIGGRADGRSPAGVRDDHPQPRILIPRHTTAFSPSRSLRAGASGPHAWGRFLLVPCGPTPAAHGITRVQSHEQSAIKPECQSHFERLAQSPRRRTAVCNVTIDARTS